MMIGFFWSTMRAKALLKFTYTEQFGVFMNPRAGTIHARTTHTLIDCLWNEPRFLYTISISISDGTSMNEIESVYGILT